ncbi:hypothetical protein V2J09_000467, partial [Rumex salicifolius]
EFVHHFNFVFSLEELGNLNLFRGSSKSETFWIVGTCMAPISSPTKPCSRLHVDGDPFPDP